jgi:hypothetical protein
MSIGCPMGQAAWVNFVLKISLLLLALVFSGEMLHAQCSGLRRDIDDFDRSWSCHLADSSRKALVIDLQIAGTIGATEIFWTLGAETALPPIDSMQLAWLMPNAHALPASQLSWAQGGDGKRLDLHLLLDGCNPIFENALRFRAILFCSKPLVDDCRLSARYGGIVQVDVIQAKMAGTETQRIYGLQGALLREMDRPLGSAPATEGLAPGIYLLRRMQGNRVTRCEKVLVW